MASFAAHAYEGAAVNNGGTIKGTVIFEGTAPLPQKIIPTKDREACGGIREKLPILLGKDNRVQSALVYLKKVERGRAWGKTGKMPILDNQKCEFVPYFQVLPVGSDLKIVNSDPVLHTVHGFLQRNTLFNMAMIKRARRTATGLNEPGMVRVECDSHGWMRAWVYVADNPYYSMTGDDGTFTIAGVPPGSYTLVAWHEYTGAVEIPVTVGSKATLDITAKLKN